MMDRKYISKESRGVTIAPLAAAIGLALGSTQLQAATITVDSLLDGSLENRCTLRDAVEAANTDTSVAGCTAGSGMDEIIFDSSIHGGTIFLTEGPIGLSSSMVIQGPGPDLLTIDGLNTHQLLRTGGIFGTHITLSRLTLQNGFADTEFEGGGAILARTAANLTLEDCVITGNTAHAPAQGGAVAFQASTPFISLVIDDCVFSENEVLDPDAVPGDVIPTAGGAIYLRLGTMEITNSEFIGNASGTLGGAVAINNDPTVTSRIIHSEFFDNESGLGGAIGLIQESQLEIESSTISGNQASFGGGVMVSSMASASISADSVLSNNTALVGGAIALGLGAPPDLFTRSDPYTGPGYMELSDTQIVFNQTLVYGGGLNVMNQSVLIAQDTEISNNTVTGFQAPEMEQRGGYFELGWGGGINVMGGSMVDLLDSEVYDNYAFRGGGLLVLDGMLELSDSIVSGNEALIGGGIQVGSIYYDTNAASMALRDSTVSLNVANAGGGAAIIDQTALHSMNSQFVDNSALGLGGGGAFLLDASPVIFTETSFVGNNGSFYGGAVLALSETDLLVEASSIMQNQARTGAGLFLDDTRTLVSYSTIAENIASETAGGIITFDGRTRILNSTITSNKASDVGGIVASGIEMNFVTLSHNESTGGVNTAAFVANLPDNPGGLLVDENVEFSIANSIVAENTGPDGPLDVVVSAFDSTDPTWDPQSLDYSLIRSAVGALPPGIGNIFGLDPQLGPLADNGGPTLTRALAATSPVIDQASPIIGAIDYDQRRAPWPRIFGERADMGAYEFFIDSIFQDRFEAP